MFSALIAFNGMLTSHCGNMSTHHYHATYHPCFDTARPRNNIFTLMPCHPEKKRKRLSYPFAPKKSVKRKQGNNCFDKDWADKLGASEKGSSYKQHEFEEGQDLEAATIVYSSHMKLLPKTVQGKR